MKSNSVHSQQPQPSKPTTTDNPTTSPTTQKKYNSITDSLNYFNPYATTSSELIPSKINYICIYTTSKDTGEDIFKQILYYGTEESFQFEVNSKGGEGGRKLSIVNNLGLFREEEEFNNNKGEGEEQRQDKNNKGNSDNEEVEGSNLFIKPRHGTPIEIQERQVGLAQAIVNFSKTFSDTHISDNIHSQKSRLIIVEPEPQYFMILNLSLAQKLRSSTSKKNQLVVDYLDFELDDNLLRAWLLNSYNCFRMAHGNLSEFLEEFGKDKFMGELESYYDLYFSQTQSFTNLHLLKSLNNNQLLYLSKQNYLYLKQQLYNQLDNLNQFINSSFIIFKGKLILDDFFALDLEDEVISYYSRLLGEEFEISRGIGGGDYRGKDDGNRSIGAGNRQSMFESWNPFKRYSTASSSSSIYSPSFQFLNLWDSSNQADDAEDSQYFKPEYLKNYNPKSPLPISLQLKLVSNDSGGIVKKFYCEDGNYKLACVYSFAPHSYLILTYNPQTSPYLTPNYFEDLERLLQPILNDTLVQLLQKDYETYSLKRSELVNNKLEFFYWNLLNGVKEICLSDDVVVGRGNEDWKLLEEVINQLKSNNLTQDTIIRTINKKRTLTNWICGKRINNGESLLVIILQRDCNIAEIEDEFRNLQNCYFNHLFLD